MLEIWCALGMMPNKVVLGLGLNAHNALVVLPHLKPLSNVLTEAWEDILAFAYRTTMDHADGNVSRSSIQNCIGDSIEYLIGIYLPLF
jgi:hypothetical protein